MTDFEKRARYHDDFAESKKHDATDQRAFVFAHAASSDKRAKEGTDRFVSGAERPIGKIVFSVSVSENWHVYTGSVSSECDSHFFAAGSSLERVFQ